MPADTLLSTKPAYRPTAAELIVEYLEALGIDQVFGVPGGAIEPLYNAMAVSMRRGGVRPVVARHEAGAAFMADGYARETGRIGVCCATSGPGATNLITGVATACDNGVPMLVITGQPTLPVFGRGALQESACTGVNTLGMFEHCTRYNTLVSHIDQLETKLVQALMRATQSPPGPVHLSIPLDLLRAPIRPRMRPQDLPSLVRRGRLVDDSQIDRLIQTLLPARRVALVIGGGCGEAMPALMRFAELTGIGFVTTPDAKGLVNPHHPLYRGVFGFAGHDSAQALLRGDVDFVLAAGTPLSEWTSAAWSPALLSQRLIHVDDSDSHLRRSPMARLHVKGCVRTVFERVTDALQSAMDESSGTSWPLLETPAAGAPGLTLREPDKPLSDDSPIKPQRLMRELSRRLPPTTRFVADAGNATAWVIHYLEARNNRRLGLVRPQSGAPAVIEAACGAPGASARASQAVTERRRDRSGWLRVLTEFAPMGWAIGAAVGIASAKPDCPVVCITGDGSYLMNGQEITVAAQLGLTVIFIVLNDAALGMVKHGQRLAGAEQVAFELPTINYAALAQAMGIAGEVVESPADFDALDMAAILARPGPTLIDVRIDPEEVPPMGLRMQTLEGQA